MKDPHYLIIFSNCIEVQGLGVIYVYQLFLTTSHWGISFFDFKNAWRKAGNE
jgi:hypothetical protein